MLKLSSGVWLRSPTQAVTHPLADEGNSGMGWNPAWNLSVLTPFATCQPALAQQPLSSIPKVSVSQQTPPHRVPEFPCPPSL